MLDFFRIVYVNTRVTGPSDGLPEDIESIRDWSWEQSGLVRWYSTDPSGLSDLLAEADLVILDWPSSNADVPRVVYRSIRDARDDLPLLVVRSDSGNEPTREDSLLSDDFAVGISTEDLPESGSIEGVFNPPIGPLPSDPPNLDYNRNDPVAAEPVEWVGEDCFRLTMEKFFPGVQEVRVWPVGGGWSGTRLCRVFPGGEDLYFVKFFTRRDEYRRELAQNERAQVWLEDALVALRLIPEIAGGIEAQMQAFPPSAPPIYPVCYYSASDRDNPRETLRSLYRRVGDEFLEAAMRRLLDILSSRQPTVDNPPLERPWTFGTERGFSLSTETTREILVTLDDLSMYGNALFSNDASDWRRRQQDIQSLLYGALSSSQWLYELVPVVRGNVHGDPNPRNVLVLRDDPSDVRLIDVGEYDPDGRLVSDMAIIERDVKLVLMGTEAAAGGFLDLDVRRLDEWRQAERDAVARGIDYQPELAPPATPGEYSSAARAYRLIGLIRERARQVSANGDPDGRHYFAALLYWTLDVLPRPEVRRTKKLLALYSATQILRRFVV